MGHLVYGAGSEYEVEDRMLAHLKFAMLAKLRVQECFVLNCLIDPAEGSGRISLWISPEIPLQFRFSGGRPPALNRVWLEALVLSARSSQGMTLMGEDEAADYIAATKSAA